MHLDLIISFTNSVGQKGLIEDHEWVTMHYYYLSKDPLVKVYLIIELQNS
jgi:hypothetical protein